MASGPHALQPAGHRFELYELKQKVAVVLMYKAFTAIHFIVNLLKPRSPTALFGADVLEKLQMASNYHPYTIHTPSIWMFLEFDG